MKFNIRFAAAKRISISVHSADCPVGNAVGRAFTCVGVEAPTAREAARIAWEGEDGEARGLKFPTICKCVKRSI